MRETPPAEPMWPHARTAMDGGFLERAGGPCDWTLLEVLVAMSFRIRLPVVPYRHPAHIETPTLDTSTCPKQAEGRNSLALRRGSGGNAESGHGASPRPTRCADQGLDDAWKVALRMYSVVTARDGRLVPDSLVRQAS